MTQLQNLLKDQNYPLLNWQALAPADDNWRFIASLIAGNSVSAVHGLYNPALSTVDANAFWDSVLKIDVIDRTRLLESETFLRGFCEGAAQWVAEQKHSESNSEETGN